MSADALVQRALALQQQQRLAEARDAYLQALALEPEHFQALHLLGVLSAQEGKPELAADLIGKALAVNPASPIAHNNLGNVRRELRQLVAAEQSFARAIALNPQYPSAHHNRGLALVEAAQYAAAVRSFDEALRIRPNHAATHRHRGHALRLEGDCAGALASYERALVLNPEDAEAQMFRGLVLFGLRRYAEALSCYEQAHVLDPSLANLAGLRLHARLQMCRWDGLDAATADLIEQVERGQAVAVPLSVMALADSAALHRQAAATWARGHLPNPASRVESFSQRNPERLRIGYFSADYREHAVASLIAGLIEAHDRSRFEIIAFSFGADTRDAMRKRLERAFDRFVDVRGVSIEEIVRRARALEIDIAVDLGGYSDGARPAIFSLGAAPLQVSYLGYPGTTAAGQIDYLVADARLIPSASRPHFSENIIYLPDCFQANDSGRVITLTEMRRTEHGLPERGFVFCCFNATYKISPQTFDSWMRILERVAGSVLWLSAAEPEAAANLRREASRRGVDPNRIVFATRTATQAEHLARHRMADLFLDTTPYNAHATASDALWAGTPVLTRVGESLPARVAASLLHAIGLSELVTETGVQYEELAVALALDSARFEKLRLRLARNRRAAPLFDTVSFTRNLEAAYEAIHARYRAGLACTDLRIDASAPARRLAADR